MNSRFALQSCAFPVSVYTGKPCGVLQLSVHVVFPGRDLSYQVILMCTVMSRILANYPYEAGTVNSQVHPVTCVSVQADPVECCSFQYVVYSSDSRVKSSLELSCVCALNTLTLCGCLCVYVL